MKHSSGLPTQQNQGLEKKKRIGYNIKMFANISILVDTLLPIKHKEAFGLHLLQLLVIFGVRSLDEWSQTDLAASRRASSVRGLGNGSFEDR